MDEYFCPQCNKIVEGEPSSTFPHVEIKCPYCGNTFHNTVDNKFDWSVDWNDNVDEDE